MGGQELRAVLTKPLQGLGQRGYSSICADGPPMCVASARSWSRPPACGASRACTRTTTSACRASLPWRPPSPTSGSGRSHSFGSPGMERSSGMHRNTPGHHPIELHDIKPFFFFSASLRAPILGRPGLWIKSSLPGAGLPTRGSVWACFEGQEKLVHWVRKAGQSEREGGNCPERSDADPPPPQVRAPSCSLFGSGQSDQGCA